MNKIGKNDLEKFNNIFDIKSFVGNYDYKNNNWFKNTNFNLLLIDWFPFSFENLKRLDVFFNNIIDSKKIYLTEFPINIEATCFSINSFIELEGNNEFFNSYCNISFIIFDRDFSIFLIHEIDMEVFYLCYDNIYNFENVDKKLLLDYHKYMIHSKNLKDKGFI